MKKKPSLELITSLAILRTAMDLRDREGVAQGLAIVKAEIARDPDVDLPDSVKKTIRQAAEFVGEVEKKD